MTTQGQGAVNMALLSELYEEMGRAVNAAHNRHPMQREIHAALDTLAFHGERYPRDYRFQCEDGAHIRVFIKPVIGLFAETGQKFIVGTEEWTDGTDDDDNDDGGGGGGPDGPAGG